MSTNRPTDDLLRIILVVIALIVLFPVLIMLFAMPMMGMMGWWGDGGPGPGLSPLWGIGTMLLVLLVLIGIGYFLFRSLLGGTINERDRAIEEVRVAYARGELTDEEYEQRLTRLQRDHD